MNKKSFEVVRLGLSIVATVFFLLGCDTTMESKLSGDLDRLEIYIQENYPQFKLMDSSFKADSVYSPYRPFTDNFQPGLLTGHPFIFSYDLNLDGHNDFIFRIYRTLTSPEGSRKDSVFESYSKLVFGSDEGFIPSFEDHIAYHGFAFSGILEYKVPDEIGVVTAGTYKSFSERYDSVTISTVGLGAYSPFGVGVSEWYSPDSVQHFFIFSAVD